MPGVIVPDLASPAIMKEIGVSKKVKKSKKLKKIVAENVEEEEADSGISDETHNRLPPKSGKKKSSKSKSLIEQEEEIAAEIVAVKPKKSKKKSRKSEESGENIEIVAANEESMETDESIGKKKKKKKRKIEETEILEPEKIKKKSKKRKMETSTETNGDGEENASEEIIEKPKSEFEEIWNKISQKTREKLTEKGITELFPVQGKTFDQCRGGENIIVQSRTGSGKTMAFGIPIVERLQEDNDQSRGRYPRALVLAPTRELASQIAKDIDSISTKLTTLSIYGGVPYERQESVLNRGCDVVVGTPGRVKDLLNKGTLNFANLKTVVLDEVDRMLDMGFADHVEQCIGAVYDDQTGSNENPQTLFFSATCPSWVKDTAQKYMQLVPEVINLVNFNDTRTSKTINHLAVKCSYSERVDVIGDLLTVYSGKRGRSIIFCATKADVDELALSDKLFDAQMIHGDIEQKTREKTLQAFRDGGMKTLVATDVAARGLDIPEVDLVIQAQPPSDVDSYIHRSGRTGRAGRSGTCICLYKPNELYQLNQVERVAKIKFEHRGAVQPPELEKAAASDVKQQIAELPQKSGERFTELANEMISEAEENGKSVTDILAAAIAIMSGVTDCSQRSLLNSKKGTQTWEMNCTFEIRGGGLIYGMLEKGLGAEMRDAAKGMRIRLDKSGGIFDLPEEMSPKILSNWSDSDRITLKKCIELPELEPLRFEGGGGGGRFGGNRRFGGGGGGGNRFGGNRNGGGRRFGGGGGGRGFRR